MLNWRTALLTKSSAIFPSAGRGGIRARRRPDAAQLFFPFADEMRAVGLKLLPLTVSLSEAMPASCYTKRFIMPSRYAQWMYDWEHRLTSVDNNRVVRQLEWGTEWARDWPCRNGYA